MKRWVLMSLLALGVTAFIAGCCCEMDGEKGMCSKKMEGSCPRSAQMVKKAKCGKCKVDAAVPGDCKKEAKCPKCDGMLVVEEGEMILLPPAPATESAPAPAAETK